MKVITVIIPYREGEPIRKPPEGDETIWMNSNMGIGEQRIEGARRAINEWLVMVDSDGYYPDNYIPKIKAAIRSGKYPYGFWAVRKGGIKRIYLESGLIIRRDVFLERTKDFAPNHRKDVYGIFHDLPIAEDITYSHNLTVGEKGGLMLLAALVLGGV